MNWFNYIGLIFVVLLLIPNIIFAIKNKTGQKQTTNKVIEVFEQIGRYGSMIFMAFNIPYTYFGFYFDCGWLLYIVIDSLLLTAYYLSWIIFWKKDTLTKSLLLSIIPSTLFVMSGILLANIPLIVFSVIFTAFHISISVKR